jgi:dolichol-phosphate mannosyltransferase
MRTISVALNGFAAIQALAGLRLWARLWRTRAGLRIEPVAGAIDEIDVVSVIVPVLNEATRIGPCLDGLIAHGNELRELLIVDGGSTDCTREIVKRYAQRDHRIRLLSSCSNQTGRNGKALQLELGLRNAGEQSDWILTIDADVRPAPVLARSLIVHARRTGISVLSAATRQRVTGQVNGLLHPSMLTSLVYRFGIPGYATQHPNRVQANGQCMLIPRDLLIRIGGFAQVANSVCEDVTLARELARSGVPVGFYEAGALAQVEMYETWRATWDNWPRSLPLRDRHARWSSLAALAGLTLTQAAPPLIAGMCFSGKARKGWLMQVNAALLITRVGVLAGTRRAYDYVDWTYWLSPLADVPVAARLWSSAFRRSHTWRGRRIDREA